MSHPHCWSSHSLLLCRLLNLHRLLRCLSTLLLHHLLYLRPLLHNSLFYRSVVSSTCIFSFVARCLALSSPQPPLSFLLLVVSSAFSMFVLNNGIDDEDIYIDYFVGEQYRGSSEVLLLAGNRCRHFGLWHEIKDINPSLFIFFFIFLNFVNYFDYIFIYMIELFFTNIIYI